jgi:hypothetical protein
MKRFYVVLLALAACSSAWADPAAKPGRTLPPAPPPPPLPDVPLVCPTDVRQCADGAYVGRSPSLDCAFVACPGDSKQ